MDLLMSLRAGQCYRGVYGMGVRAGLLFGAVLACLGVRAQVVFNEIYADVTADGECGAFGEPVGTTLCGDANGDYSVSTLQDEFVELVNVSGVETMDLSGWTLHDRTALRHTFPNGTLLLPRSAVLVFGGGTPDRVFGGDRKSVV